MMGRVKPGDRIRYLKGVGPVRAEILHRLGVETVEDILRLRPRRFLDRRGVVPVSSLKNGETATIAGQVESVEMGGGRAGKVFVRASVRDATGTIQLLWFNQPYMASRIRPHMMLTATGRVKFHPYHGLQMVPQEWEPLESARPELLPIYPLTEGLSQRQLRRLIDNALSSVALEEYLPGWLLARRLLPDIKTAYMMLHHPETEKQFEEALRRFKFEELLLLQLGALARRRFLATHNAHPLSVSPTLHQRILARFPFQLTPAQKRVIKEISADLTSKRPMHRLLQGDVGSGKTVVALYAMLVAVGNRKQAALMAPTEILAEQHFLSIGRMLEGSRVRLGLLTSSTPQKGRTLERIKKGQIDIVVGTHALLAQGVEFPELVLVVIDEQHRFGVAQRVLMLEKASVPHLLVMTATPIPRSLALTLFGDTDVSVIDEMVPGRAPVETDLLDMSALDDVVVSVRDALSRGERAFIVCPAIESGEGWRGVVEAHRWWSRRLLPYRVGILHGRMGRVEREATMAAFREGETPALVATTVIEVGIDVPEATVMVVEHAERYGLAQLHQLRGRIGRGGKPGRCFLLRGEAGEEAQRRLEILARTCDGFKIAEEDLRLRGMGEFFGTRQSGMHDMRFVEMDRDIDLLYAAREDAEELLRRGVPPATRRWLSGKLGPVWRLLVS